MLMNPGNTVIYTGVTNNLERRVAEKRIKGWTREKKIALIKTINPEFKDLLDGN